jgi:UDP-N-acetylglucosamine 2-epimerase (non-hydrolysing)
MRHCVFVVGSPEGLIEIAPILKRAVAAGLKHDVWLTANGNGSPADLLANLGVTSTLASGSDRAGRPGLLGASKCFDHVASIKTWMQRPPLVVVYGESVSAFLATMAGRFAGAWIVHLESGLSSGRLFEPFPAEILRRLTFRMTNFALCSNDEAYERMRRYHCKVTHIGSGISAADGASEAPTAAWQATVNALLNWSK